jgi:hypothetical protein
MARKKMPAKTPAMEYPAVSFCKYDRNPDELRALEARNRKLISSAIGCANHTIKPYAAIFKGKTIERLVFFQENGSVYHVPKDAPKAVQLAEQFLIAVNALDIAANDGDVKFVKECAIEVGVMAVKVVVEATRRKSLGDVLRKHGDRISGSSKGGKVEPVWEPVAEIARETFEKFKSGGGVSDNAALDRTKKELVRLVAKGELNCTVPGMTCLREHLVTKPSSGK